MIECKQIFRGDQCPFRTGEVVIYQPILPLAYANGASPEHSGGIVTAPHGAFAIKELEDQGNIWFDLSAIGAASQMADRSNQMLP